MRKTRDVLFDTFFFVWSTEEYCFPFTHVSANISINIAIYYFIYFQFIIFLQIGHLK